MTGTDDDSESVLVDSVVGFEEEDRRNEDEEKADLEDIADVEAVLRVDNESADEAAIEDDILTVLEPSVEDGRARAVDLRSGLNWYRSSL